MRVGIDIRPLRPESSGGLVQLTEGLCQSLFLLAPDDVFVVFQSHAGYRLPGPLPMHVTEVVLPVAGGPAALDDALTRARVDVLFRPFPIKDALEFPPHRRVVLVPDFQHNDCPENFSHDELLTRQKAFCDSINQGGAVGLLSRHADQRLRACYPEARARRLFVPPGPPFHAQMLQQPLTDAERRLLPTEPFFLYPANFWPHKNHQRLVLAFQHFIAQRPEPWTLILTGDDFQSQHQLLEAFPSLPVRHLGFVSSRLLVELYRRCTALTYFSLYEGFGIPLLEAFQLGAPVLCSNTTSLLEVSGDAALQCDPTDVAAMAARMDRVADSPNLRAELQQRGYAQLKRYDWTLSARSLLNALHEVAQEPVRDDSMRVTVEPHGGQPHASQDDGRQQGRAQAVFSSAPGLHHSRNGHPPQSASANAGIISGTPHEIQRPHPALPDDTGLLVSVILPTADHRGQALESVRSWARTQTLPRDRYEVIIVSDGSEPELDDQIRVRLHPQDRIVYGPPGVEARLYDVGARAARGRWLFFTEAHCFGDSQCLEAMVRYLDASGEDGASARSQGITKNYLSRMEERLFDEAAAYRLEPEHWNKIFMRGSALSRELYLDVGGLTWRYGLFAEPDLAARLHASGYKIGHAPAAVVQHVNTESVAELRSAVHDYGGGECTYLTEHPDGDGHRYFGTPDWWSKRSLLDPGVGLNLWRSLGQSLLQPGDDWQARGARWIELLPAAMLGKRWRVWEADWTVWQAQARCWWWRHRDDKLMSAYRELWPALARQAGIHALAEAQARQTVPVCGPGDTFEIAELTEAWHTGLHAIEELDGDRFRWTSPVACLKLPLTPGPHVLRLDTHGLRPDVRMAAFLNGHRLKIRDVQTQLGEVQLALRREHFNDGPFQYLVLICEPLRPWLHDVPDQRELGLPLFRITSARKLSDARHT